MIEGYAPCVSCSKYVEGNGCVTGRPMCNKCISDREFLRSIELHFAVSRKKNGLILESWTKAGVNLSFELKKGQLSFLEAFKNVVSDFDVAELVKRMREDEEYKANFSIEESFDDFELYKRWLINIYQNVEGELK